MEFSNSKLANYAVFTSKTDRTKRIDTIIVAEVSELLALGDVKGHRTSAHYIVCTDGKIGQYADEKHAISHESDTEERAIIIVTSKSAEAKQSLVNLISDICIRNGISMLKLIGDMPGLATINEEVNDILEDADIETEELITKEYVLEKDAKLRDIAKDFGLEVSDLLICNDISNPNKNVKKGTVIYIPCYEDEEEEKPTLKSYTVVEGDTFKGIAERFGIDYKVLAKLNGIKPPYKIKVGQVIYLE